MGIKEDLANAKADVAGLVSVQHAVKKFSIHAGISEEEAAHWLVLKGVHMLVPAYHRYSLGHAKEKLPLSDDRKGYKAVYDELARIANPSPFSMAPIIMQTIANLHSGPVVCWSESEITSFIAANGGYVAANNQQQSSPPRITNGDTGIKQVRRDKLLAAIRAKFDDPMDIPTPGKAQLRSELCDSDPSTFTDSTFDDAWKDLSAEGIISIQGKERFARGKHDTSSSDDIP